MIIKGTGSKAHLTLDYENSNCSDMVKMLVTVGLLEEVEVIEEPKTLEEKFSEMFKSAKGYECTASNYAQIARDHYLEVFNKYAERQESGKNLEKHPVYELTIKYIRTALEKG